MLPTCASDAAPSRRLEAMVGVSSPEDSKNTESFVPVKGFDLLVFRSQRELDLGCGAVSLADPNDLRGVPEQDAAVTEIDVLCHDYEITFAGVRPYLAVRGPAISDGVDMCRAWEVYYQCVDKSGR